MTRIGELVEHFCPDGVKFEPIRDLGVWYGGGTPSRNRQDYWDRGTIPWLSPKDMGKPIVDSTEDHITESAVRGSATKLVPANSVAVVVRSSILDKFLPIAFVPIPVTLNQDMKALAPRRDVLARYVAHLLRSVGQPLLRATRKTGGSVASIQVPKLMAFRVPVPPVEVQRELVRMLDTFSTLEAELEAELEARRRQYAYYRDRLLAFADRTDVQWLPMGELGDFVRGRRFVKDDMVDDGVPAIHYGEIYTRYGVTASVAAVRLRPELAPTLRYARPGDVVIVDVGETVQDVGKAMAWLGDYEVAIHDHTFAFRHGQNPAYLAYYLQTAAFQREKARFVARTKVKTLSMPGIATIRIPVPSRAEQDRIVATLAAFDALLNDLSVGIPAELKARRRQYEYYRDRLLTFEEAPS